MKDKLVSAAKAFFRNPRAATRSFLTTVVAVGGSLLALAALLDQMGVDISVSAQAVVLVTAVVGLARTALAALDKGNDSFGLGSDTVTVSVEPGGTVENPDDDPGEGSPDDPPAEEDPHEPGVPEDAALAGLPPEAGQPHGESGE